jgi:hypothetical protein
MLRARSLGSGLDLQSLQVRASLWRAKGGELRWHRLCFLANHLNCFLRLASRPALRR